MGEEQQIRYRKGKNERDEIESRRTISSILSTDENTPTKNKYFTRFRGLGCTAPAQVSVPTIIRASANWEGKKKMKMKKKKNCISSNNGEVGSDVLIPAAAAAVASPSSCLVVPDVWCGPGIGSVDCVVSRRPTGKLHLNNINIRERGSYGGGRMVHPEDVPFSHVFGASHHLRHPSPQHLAQIVMLQGNLVMGGRLDHDRYRDWRLDVDTMSYEELLELGDKMGYVNTGLREDEIGRCVRKTKPPVVSEMQWKCTICQEEYEEEDEIGKVECGHLYHIHCINQWLLNKKTCPVCKLPVDSLQ